QSVRATAGSNGSGAATASTRQAKIDASPGARQTSSLARGFPPEHRRPLRHAGITTGHRLSAPPREAEPNENNDAERDHEGERPPACLTVVLLAGGRGGGGRLSDGPGLNLRLTRAELWLLGLTGACRRRCGVR